MSDVSLTIGGRRYTVACAPGEECHIELLGRSIDDRLARLPNMAGQSESRTLLFAALLLADELHEAGAGRASPKPPGRSDETETAAALEALADRLESVAARLESPAADA